MNILKYLDVLIGLAVVMVLLSPLVTALTQLWLWLRNRRSIFLLQALERLILQFHRTPGDPAWIEAASAIAAAVSNHPLIARTPLPGAIPRIPPFKNRSAEVIEREELVRILLELATGEGAGAQLNTEHRQALKSMLADNDVADPAASLNAIRTKAQEFEKTEPGAPAHVRNTKAIIEAVKSQFVGKINEWFDPVMARATQQYAAEARAVTIVSSLIVAFAVQVDSLTLLKRLSADDALRTALLTEARDQQALRGLKPGEDGGVSAQGEDLSAFNRRQQELERNLATLREPALAISPERFVWQPLGQAALEFNPTWDRPPQRKTYELRAGGSAFTLHVTWRRGVLEDIRDAVVKSGAPVGWRLVSSGDHVLIRSDRPMNVHVRGADGIELSEPLQWASVATLPRATLWTPPAADTQLDLIVDDQHHPVPVAGGTDIARLFEAIPPLITAADKRLAVWCSAADGAPRECANAAASTLVIASPKAEAHEIRLMTRAQDPFSNLLSDTERQPTIVRVPASALDGSLRMLTFSATGIGPISVPPALQPPVSPTPQRLVTAINGASRAAQIPISASPYPARSVVFTAQRPGSVDLRWDATRADTNMLNEAERYWPFTEWTQQTLLGLGLTWTLLSLGASFWFDALKNLLKLRPPAAATEQEHREDRQNQSK